jgi:hypothetical protein
MFKFGWLTITAEDLVVWERFPGAAFTLMETATTEDGNEFRLGIFDPGNEKLYDIVFKVAERTATRVSSPNCPFGTVM